MSERSIEAGGLSRLLEEVFQACGMATGDAALLADSLVQADLGGVHSHGVMRVREYVDKLTKEGVDPCGRPSVARQVGTCLVVDGHNSMGQIGAHFAMQQALEQAAAQGMGATAVRGSNHCGALAYFARQALDRDMIGLVTTNALPTMAPVGGAERIVGINPLAVAIPSAGPCPIVYDAAFSGSSHGKLRIHQQKGLPVPQGWAMDKDGQPTTDAAAAIDGLLAPIGGFKGVSLAMIMGMLSSLLSGASYGTELGDMESGPRPGQDGHFVAAIRIDAFVEADEFKGRVSRVIEQVHNCRKAPGTERLYVAGELEWLRRQEYLRDGIPLNEVTLADIGAAARVVGVESPAWLL
ncbi:MAG: Ldh family oxidoreductase [Candidatus Latescibacteria bacterium]|nr:Ldh family oxidoreductase [Candidatus Latescibacterota bacterium]